MIRVADMFQSIQGEGVNAGRPASFLRFAGCNGGCPWCDTNHETREVLEEEEIVRRLAMAKPRFLVITGGEPTLQLTETLLGRLAAVQFEVAIETNGSIEIQKPLRRLLNWITVSPKTQFGIEFNQRQGDELKVVWDGTVNPLEIAKFTSFKFRVIQPEWKEQKKHLPAMLKFLQENPEWRISLQLHRMLGVP